MDEPETIPRREAAMGLGLLGLCTAALVATVVFRIVHSSPRRTPQPAPNLWASQEAAITQEPALAQEVRADGDSSPGEEPLVAADFPPATPIPTIGEDRSSVPATSTAETSATVSLPPPSEVSEPPVQPVDTRPHFVAPGGR